MFKGRIKRQLISSGYERRRERAYIYAGGIIGLLGAYALPYAISSVVIRDNDLISFIAKAIPAAIMGTYTASSGFTIGTAIGTGIADRLRRKRERLEGIK